MALMEFKQSRAVPANIEYLATRFKLNREKIAAIMAISVSALYNRMVNPETFRLDELERMATWATKHGYNVSLAQLTKPFVPAPVKSAEESA